MATEDPADSREPPEQEKSAGRELADGLGSLFRAARKVVAEVDPARLEALGKKAFRELDATRLGELGRKAVARVERFDPTELGRVTELFSVVEKAVDRVESFVRQPGGRSDAPDAADATGRKEEDAPSTAAASTTAASTAAPSNPAGAGEPPASRLRVDE